MFTCIAQLFFIFEEIKDLPQCGTYRRTNENVLTQVIDSVAKNGLANRIANTIFNDKRIKSETNNIQINGFAFLFGQSLNLKVNFIMRAVNATR